MSGEDSAKIDIQERDLDILSGLFECRVMSLKHITVLYFSGRSEAAKKRIQKLKSAGYLNERSRFVGDPSVLHLGKKAFAILRDSGKLSGLPSAGTGVFERRAQVSDLTLRHELEVTDVRVAFLTALRSHPSLSKTEFTTWPALNQFIARPYQSSGRKQMLVKPDGFLRLKEEAADGVFEHMFFLEVDRSTETQEIIRQKAACYLDYYQSGGMAVRFGASREEFKSFPFRVLMVFRNEERRNNAAERLLQNSPPILTQVWLSTYAEVIERPLGDIWMRPKDYLEVTKGSRFEPKAPANGVYYRRQSERENFIRSRIPKYSLVEEKTQNS